MSKYTMMRRRTQIRYQTKREKRLRVALSVILAILGSVILVERVLSNYAEETQLLVEQFIREEQRNMQLAELYFREQFRAAVETQLDPGKALRATAGDDLRAVLRRLSGSGFTSVAVYDAEGQLLESVGEAVPTEPPSRPDHPHSTDGADQIASSFSVRDGVPVNHYSYPLMVNGQPAGKVVALLPYARQLSLISRELAQPYDIVVPGREAPASADSWPPGDYSSVPVFPDEEMSSVRRGIRTAGEEPIVQYLIKGEPAVVPTTVSGESYAVVMLPLGPNAGTGRPYVLFYEPTRAFSSLLLNSTERVTIGAIFILSLVIILVVTAKARDKAEEANRMQSLFLANVSHELRTPMNGVLGMITALEAPDLPEEKRQEFIRLLRQSSDSLLHLLNSILDMSRLEAARVEITPVATDLWELVRDTATQMKNAELADDLEVRVDISEQAPHYIYADRQRLRQIITNCLHNALKFTSEGGVTVALSAAGSPTHPAVQFRIIDTGMGIEPDRIDTIFEKFTQASAAAARRYGGSGLGLSIVKGLVELLRGTIEVESVPQVGTTFTITVPVKLTTEQAVAEQQQADTTVHVDALASDRVLHVLLAEDDHVNAVVTSEILRKQGWSVEVAANGLEAVELGQDGSFDIILMDRQMPAMDGLEATRELTRRWSANQVAATPIIGLSASIAPEDQRKCLEAGMVGFVPKPVSAGSLIAQVARSATIGPPIDLAVAESSFDTDTELVNEVLPIFLEQAGERLSEITQGLKEEDAPRIGRQTHPLKTAARYLGAHRLGALASEMDQMATHPDQVNWQTMSQLGNQLTEELSRIAQWVEATVSKSPA
jgi:signal transduction histidine kinase/DNA-binding NarL/FixJ family response regulator